MVEEQPVWIALNGVRRIVLSCSPHESAALAIGHLLAEGWINRAEDVLALRAGGSPKGTTGVLVETDPQRVDACEMLRRHQTLTGCGIRHFLDCDPFAFLAVRAEQLPQDPAALLRVLFDAVNAAAPEGGVHGGALSNGLTLDYVAIDVARHSAIDRAIGHGVRAGADLGTLGLVTTARVTGAMVLKAIRARIGWICSRSVATSLAQELASVYGLQLLERAGRPHPGE